jgi:hypothetical protein
MKHFLGLGVLRQFTRIDPSRRSSTALARLGAQENLKFLNQIGL